jgi:hypothetical protein
VLRTGFGKFSIFHVTISTRSQYLNREFALPVVFGLSFSVGPRAGKKQSRPDINKEDLAWF